MEYEVLLLINTLGVIVIAMIIIYHCLGKFSRFQPFVAVPSTLNLILLIFQD